MSIFQKWMGKAKLTLTFDLPKTIEVELADEALKLGVPEKFRSDFSLHENWVQDVNVGSGGIPGDNLLVARVLSRIECTSRSFSSLLTKFPFLSYFCIFEIIIILIEFESDLEAAFLEEKTFV